METVYPIPVKEQVFLFMQIKAQIFRSPMTPALVGTGANICTGPPRAKALAVSNL